MTIFRVHAARERNLEWLPVPGTIANDDQNSQGALDRPVYESAKRLFDIFFVLLASMLAIPLILIVAGVIKYSSRGPVLYQHTRIGRYGKPFRCFKLRTMFQGADGLLEDETFHAQFSTGHKLRQDPRITSVGRFLRRTSLDELPQLWNVLRGDMSIVGPRPVVEEELREKYLEDAWAILYVQPGLTGLWQVSGRSLLTYERRIALDIEYFARRSFGLDLWILCRTPLALVLMRGAF